MKKIKRGVVIALVLAFVAEGCGGGSSGPQSFDALSNSVNTKSVSLTTSAKGFADAYNALSAFDPTTATGAAIVAPLDALITAGDLFTADLDSYNVLIEEYGAETASASVSKGSSIAKQSADPLVVLDIKNLIAAAKTDSEIVTALIASGESPDEAQAALKDYQLNHMGSAFSTGVTAVVAAGAAALAGSAAATAGAPVLVVTGIAIVAGTAVGAVWSWCTSSSSMIVKSDSSQTCAMATVEGKTMTLPDGSTGVALTLPAGGPGNLCLHSEGMAPVCVRTTVDASGTKVSTCFVEATADGAAGAKACEVATTEGAQDVVGADCATDVKSVSASAVISGGATVTIVTNLPTPGCTISYFLVGTDFYTQSGTPATEADGRVSFSIPGGATGVHDEISLTANASGASTSIGYTF